MRIEICGNGRQTVISIPQRLVPGRFLLRKYGNLSTPAAARLWKEIKKLDRGWVLVQVESADGENIKIVL